MTPLPWWAKTLALAGLLAGAYWWGASVQNTECKLAAASRDIEAYGAQSAMQARIDAADQALAEKQAVILQGVAVETIKYKVVYRAGSKTPLLLAALLIAGCSTSTVPPTALPSVATELLTQRGPLLDPGGDPVMLGEAIEWNAAQCLSDRQALERWQEWYRKARVP